MYSRFFKWLAGVFLIFFLIYFTLSVYLDYQEHDVYNVVIIAMDAVRQDYLGAYGFEKPVSVSIDSLAEEGILFEEAISQSWTIPSIYSLMTSKYPNSLGFSGYMSEPIKESEITLGKILSENGFLTQAINNHPFLNGSSGLERSFDSISSFVGKNDSEMNEFVLEWLDLNYQRQFFLYLHYWGAHAPYISSEEFCQSECSEHYNKREFYLNLMSINLKLKDINNSDINEVTCLYECSINQTDFLVSSVINRLKSLGIYNNTIVIVTSDHGEHLFDKVDWIGHGMSLYNELVLVPLIVRLPGKERNLRIRERVQLIDIFPTITDFLDIDYETNFSGNSLLPLIEGETYGSRAIMSGYLPDMMEDTKFMLSNENMTVMLGKVSCRHEDFYTCVSEKAEHEGYEIDMTKYPNQIDLHSWMWIIRFLRCGDEYFSIWAGLRPNVPTDNVLNYLDSAKCGETNQTERYTIGNFSIEYIQGTELNLTNHLFSIFLDNWKYIYSTDGSKELYNLSEDRQESNNLAIEYPEVTEELHGYGTTYLSVSDI